MSKIVADTIPMIIGCRYHADWDRLDNEGNIVTHLNVPFLVLREASKEEYLSAHPGAPNPRGHLFYEVSID